MTDIQPDKQFRPLRSLTRLLVGSILLGSELLESKLQTWDISSETVNSAQTQKDSEELPAFESLPESLPAPQISEPTQTSRSTAVRYALIGLIFEGEDKLEEAMDAVKQIGNHRGRVLNPLNRSLHKLGAMPLMSDSFDQLKRHGQSAVDRWISRGREEEIHSRQLTQTATTSTVDQSISYMAENEAITDLIQTQGVSFAQQILEQVRSISVSVDYLFEGLLRYLFRRPPRYLLPPPNQNVQEQANWMLRNNRNEKE